MGDIGIGLIGSGYMGRTYAEGISKYNEGGRLVAVYGGSRAPGLAEDYGMDYEPTLESLLASQDLLREKSGDLTIATTNNVNRKILEITRLDQRIEVFDSVIEFERRQRRVGVREEIDQELSLAGDDSGANYEVLVGFQLTAEQLEQNRR